AKYKNAEIPVRMYMTSDNKYTSEPVNFYQVGFHNKRIELDAGDLNPNFDNLVLTGIRVRGAKLKLKVGKSSFQVLYGDMVHNPVEGSLAKYLPGTGLYPTTFANDSQYVSSGIYKRWMLGGRAEIVSRSENLKLGFT